jgi:hypothetical protein
MLNRQLNKDTYEKDVPHHVIRKLQTEIRCHHTPFIVTKSETLTSPAFGAGQGLSLLAGGTAHSTATWANAERLRTGHG